MRSKCCHLRDGAPNDASVSPQAAIHYQPHLDEVDQGLGDLGVDVGPDVGDGLFRAASSSFSTLVSFGFRVMLSVLPYCSFQRWIFQALKRSPLHSATSGTSGTSGPLPVELVPFVPLVPASMGDGGRYRFQASWKNSLR